MFKKGDRVRYVGTYAQTGRATVLRDQVEGALVPISFDRGPNWSAYPSNLELIDQPAGPETVTIDPKITTFSIDFKMIYSDDDLELWSVTPGKSPVVYSIRHRVGGSELYRADVVIPANADVFCAARVKDDLHPLVLGEWYKRGPSND